MDAQKQGLQNILAMISRFKVLIGVVFVAIIIGIFVVVTIVVPASSVPAEFIKVQHSVAFPVYYSPRPPAELTLDKNSISSTPGVVLYSYTHGQGKRVIVTVQPRASNFDTGQFNPTSEFMTRIGRAYLVDLDDRTTAAIVGEKSWVLINAPGGIADDIFRKLIDSLQPLPD